MSLSSTSQDATLCSEGVLFWMKDAANKTVPILVTSRTLHEAEEKPFPPFDDLVRFRAHRQRFEQIAREKHVSGHVQDDGGIRIINGDLTDM